MSKTLYFRGVKYKINPPIIKIDKIKYIRLKDDDIIIEGDYIRYGLKEPVRILNDFWFGHKTKAIQLRDVENYEFLRMILS